MRYHYFYTNIIYPRLVSSQGYLLCSLSECMKKTLNDAPTNSARHPRPIIYDPNRIYDDPKNPKEFTIYNSQGKKVRSIKKAKRKVPYKFPKLN